MPILNLAARATLRPAHFSTLLLVLIGLAMSGITLSSREASAAEVLNFEDQPIIASLTTAEIKKGIMKAGMARGWQVKETGPGELTATIHVRTHTATVAISYNSKTYSIRYKDSTNLKYKNGKIHRNYNKWVNFLKTDIDRELSF
mgnify:CR=1 FL=1